MWPTTSLIRLMTKITFWSLLKVQSQTDLWVKTVWKIQFKVGIKCHQSCLVALGFCVNLYTKLAVSLCSFSQFSFPFNFRTAKGLALKFGTLPVNQLFSNTFLAILISIFRSRVIHRFVPKNGPNLTCGRVLLHNFISKGNLKIQSKGFTWQTVLAEETKRTSLASPVFNLKALEFGAFLAYFHLFRYLKEIQLSQNCAKTFQFQQAFRQKPFEASPSGFKISF